TVYYDCSQQARREQAQKQQKMQQSKNKYDASTNLPQCTKSSPWLLVNTKKYRAKKRMIIVTGN
ncbi:hypothetical protein L9F63_008911, partial [Diploptera punctata]